MVPFPQIEGKLLMTRGQKTRILIIVSTFGVALLATWTLAGFAIFKIANPTEGWWAPGIGALALGCYIAHLFRLRMYGRGLIVAWYSMDGGWMLGLSATAGTMASYLLCVGGATLTIIGLVALGLSIFLLILALKDGPAYGWESHID